MSKLLLSLGITDEYQKKLAPELIEVASEIDLMQLVYKNIPDAIDKSAFTSNLVNIIRMFLLQLRQYKFNDELDKAIEQEIEKLPEPENKTEENKNEKEEKKANTDFDFKSGDVIRIDSVFWVVDLVRENVIELWNSENENILPIEKVILNIKYKIYEYIPVTYPFEEGDELFYKEINKKFEITDIQQKKNVIVAGGIRRITKVILDVANGVIEVIKKNKEPKEERKQEPNSSKIDFKTGDEIILPTGKYTIETVENSVFFAISENGEVSEFSLSGTKRKIESGEITYIPITYPFEVGDIVYFPNLEDESIITEIQDKKNKVILNDAFNSIINILSDIKNGTIIIKKPKKEEPNESGFEIGDRIITDDDKRYYIYQIQPNGMITMWGDKIPLMMLDANLKKEIDAKNYRWARPKQKIKVGDTLIINRKERIVVKKIDERINDSDSTGEIYEGIWKGEVEIESPKSQFEKGEIYWIENLNSAFEFLEEKGDYYKVIKISESLFTEIEKNRIEPSDVYPTKQVPFLRYPLIGSAVFENGFTVIDQKLYGNPSNGVLDIDYSQGMIGFESSSKVAYWPIYMIRTIIYEDKPYYGFGDVFQSFTSSDYIDISKIDQDEIEFLNPVVFPNDDFTQFDKLGDRAMVIGYSLIRDRYVVFDENRDKPLDYMEFDRVNQILKTGLFKTTDFRPEFDSFMAKYEKSKKKAKPKKEAPKNSKLSKAEIKAIEEEIEGWELVDDEEARAEIKKLRAKLKGE